MEELAQTTEKIVTFFERPGVEMVNLPHGVPFGIERIWNADVKIGGVYGTWGECYDNQALPAFLESRLGEPIPPEKRLNLAELGFVARHHIAHLTPEQHFEVEKAVGAHLLREAVKTCGWETSEIAGVLIGLSAPVSSDYLDEICKAAGIPDDALKVILHKACDSSTGALHLSLNPTLAENEGIGRNVAKTLLGKKVLVGGIEGLSRFVSTSRDANALQLFGNGAGVIGVIPGETMKFIAGKTHEVFDEDGVLQVQMYYPHCGPKQGTMLDVVQTGLNSARIAGLMHEPATDESVIMAGPMGMVKLFVRTGVQVVLEVYREYRRRMEEWGTPEKSPAVAVVHHANYKINKLKEKHLLNEGISLPMPWVLSEFGNISAGSNMIAFLRLLPTMKKGDHILIDGFGAGTYYDALVVELPA